jgi:hypothetical protein
MILDDGMEAFKKGAAGFIPRLCEMVVQDPEHQVTVYFSVAEPEPKF